MKEYGGYYWDVQAWRNSRRVKAMDHVTRAIYREVMDEIWINGGIPNDPAKVALLTGWPVENVAKSWPMIHDILTPTKCDQDVFTSERLEQERVKRDKIRRKRRKAAHARWMQMHSTSKANGKHVPANGMQESAITRTSTRTSINNIYDQRFAEFWSEYPKKVGKGEARKIFLRLKPDETLHAAILAKVREGKSSFQWKKDNGQFVPNPATWLNQGRWDDEMPKARAVAARGVEL